MIVLERLLQAVAMATLTCGRLRRRRHHDVRVAVTVGAVSAMRVLDDFEQPVHVSFRIMVMTVLVLVIVPMRHLSMLGQRRSAPAGQDQPERPGGRPDQQRSRLRDRLFE